MEPKFAEAFAAHGRARKGRHRQSRREPHGRPLLAARAAAGPDPGDRGQPSRPPSPPSRTSPPGSTRARSPAPPASSASCSSSASAARRSARSSSARRWAGSRPAATGCASTSSTTPTRTAWTTCSRKSAASSRRTLVVVISKSGRHARDAQRHARGRRRVQGRRPRLSEAFRRRDRRRLEARPDRAEGRLARAFPDVGLGRRPHLRTLRRGPAARRAAGHQDRPACSPAPPRWTRPPASRRSRRTPPRCSPRCGIGPPTAAARATWSCCPTRTACCSSRATSSSSSWSRSARSSISRAAWSTRASPSTATRAPPTSTPTCSSCARA